MDKPSTIPPQLPSSQREATASSFLTSIVLLVGVSGGLFIVVTVILICKYCHGRGKQAKRDGFGEAGSESLAERKYCALHRYETINSDVFSDPSSCSIDGPPLTPRKQLDFKLPDFNQELEEPTETTRLKNDYEQADYSHQDSVHIPLDQFLESAAALNDQEAIPAALAHTGSATVTGCGSRYIEGDYHHLKHTKIGRTPIPRQFSMGGAGSALPGRIFLDDPQFRFSSLDERLTNASGQGSQYTNNNNVPHQNDPILRSLKELQHNFSSSQSYILGGGSQQHLQQHQFPQLQQTPPREQRRHTFTKDISPKHSRDTLVIDIHRSSNDKINSPSPTYTRSPRMLKNSPSPTFNYVRDGTKLSPSPPNSRSLRESRSTSPLALSARERGDGCGTDSPPSPFMPIKEFNLGRTPSPPYKTIKTQVEVHQQLQHNAEASCNSSTNSEDFHQQLQMRLDRTRSCTGHDVSPVRNNTPFSRNKALHSNVYSSSLESANPTQRSTYVDSRKVKSYDDYREDYDVLKITEFSRGPFHSTDYDVMAELGSPTSSKVRYNDTGSLEQLHDEEGASGFCGAEYRRRAPALNQLKEPVVGISGDAGNGTGNGNRKYHALWRLRATLEEEEECSDTIRMEDMTSPDDSPDREHATPNTTSFESNALSDPCTSDHRDSGIQFEATVKTPNQANLLHPNYENRRQNYRNVMNNMLRGNQSTSVENSFDSVETDGEVSDTSRYEVTTTSFESTTDNTDSTTESQASRLKQMKADSGYKSLESQKHDSKDVHESESNGHSTDTRKGVLRAPIERKEDSMKRVNLSDSRAIEPIMISCTSSRDRHVGAMANGGATKHSYFTKTPSHPSYFDRRNGKTASKKRREYSRERQSVHVDESIYEPETDSRSDLHSGDSFEENLAPNKASLFTRFFKSHARGHKSQYLVRDYSIDEKTNTIFNEFVRQEIPPDQLGNGRLGVRRSPRMHRHRFQRKHTEPALLSEERLARRNRLAPGMRSASLGSDSSASSARRISPQDSIEEEEIEAEETAATVTRASYSFDRPSTFGLPNHRGTAMIKRQFQSIGIHDIPIIKLPEEEWHETH